MNILEAIILGIVQGATEFIPVSSSGHLVLADQFLGVDSSFTFGILLNIGTLAALIIYFRQRFLNLAKEIFSQRNFGYGFTLLIAILPAAIAGFLLSSRIEQLSENGWIIVITLGLVGLLMLVAGQPRAKPRIKNDHDSLFKDGLIVGAAQAVALIPGVSRSGSTILAALNRGYSAKAAADFSFMIGAPTIFGAIVYSLFWDGGVQFIGSNSGVFLAGNAASFLCGMLAVRVLIKFLSDHGLKVFGWYRLGVAGLLAILLITGII